MASNKATRSHWPTVALHLDMGESLESSILVRPESGIQRGRWCQFGGSFLLANSATPMTWGSERPTKRPQANRTGLLEKLLTYPGLAKGNIEDKPSASLRLL